MNILDLLFGRQEISTDVIDSYFVQTDLKDMPLTNDEYWQIRQYDSMADKTKMDDRPVGKQVR